VRCLFLPAAGDAREESPAEKTRKAEDDGGMFNLIFNTLACNENISIFLLKSREFNVIQNIN